MNPDIRPQDDLFGHVNGRWLDETEIPSDKSSWGAFIALADAAEQQVRDIITELADRPADQLDADERKIGDLYASFMDTDTIEAKGLRPVKGLLDRARRLADLTELAAFLGMFERIGGPGLFGSYITPDRADASRNIVYLAQGGLGLPDESYYRRREVRRDPRQVRRLPHHAAHPQRPRRPGRRRRPRCWPTRPALAEGHWEAAETRDVQKTTNHKTPRRAARAVPGLRLGHLRHRPRRHRGDAAHHDRDAARLLLPPLRGARRDADRDLARRAAPAHRAQLGAVPPRRVRPGQLRLLRPHPQRHARAARPLEARRRLRRGRDRRGRRQGLRHAPLPADVEADDGRARRQPRHGLPPLDRGARLDGRGHQAEGLRQARPLLPQDRLPDRSSATTPRSPSPPTT